MRAASEGDWWSVWVSCEGTGVGEVGCGEGEEVEGGVVGMGMLEAVS